MSDTFYQGRYSVSNVQWKIIEPFLPPPKFGGRPALNSRTVFNAILWILGSGATWRDLPEKYGNWNSIYHKFRNWIKAGVFEKIFQALVGKCEKYHLVEIDSTSCKVHQHAAGARKILENQDIGKLLEDLSIEGKKYFGWKAYASNKVRTFISEHNAKACIPDKSNAVVIHEFDKELYKARNIIERFFNRNTLRQIVRLLFKFCSYCRRYDTNLDFASTP